MRTVFASYAKRQLSGSQDTDYVLRLMGQDFSTRPVKDLSTTSLIMERPGLVQSSTNFLSGASSIGSMSLHLLDRAKAITDLRQAGPIKGAEAEVHQGYRGLAWSQWIPVLRGRATGFSLDRSGLAYNLEISDRFEPVAVERFTSKAMAAEYWTGATKSWDGGSLILDSESGAAPYTRATMTGNPVDLMLKLLLSGGPSAGGYNVWPAWAGAGLSTDMVDVTACETERDAILTVDFEIIQTGAIRIKEMIEVEIAKALGGYTMLTGDGSIRIRYPAAPNSTAALQDLGDRVLIEAPGWGDSSDLHITHIDVELDHDGSDYLTKLPRRASPQVLAGKYQGEERLHKISSKGLKTALGGISVADAVCDALFARYGDPPPRIKLSTFFSQHLVEAGDTVKTTSRRYPNTDGRGVGAERLLEVLSVRPNRNRVEFDCIDLTGPLTAGQRAVIAPPGQDVWVDADATERTYGYLADDISETMSDGAPAMIWG